jgi:hypothetical protein
MIWAAAAVFVGLGRVVLGAGDRAAVAVSGSDGPACLISKSVPSAGFLKVCLAVCNKSIEEARYATGIE